MVKGGRKPYRYPDKGRKKEWAYERFKADLQDIPMTPKEDEERIKEWCDRNNF